MQDAVQRMVEAVEGHPDFMNLMFIEMVEFKSVHAQATVHHPFPSGDADPAAYCWVVSRANSPNPIAHGGTDIFGIVFRILPY